MKSRARRGGLWQGRGKPQQLLHREQRNVRCRRAKGIQLK